MSLRIDIHNNHYSLVANPARQQSAHELLTAIQTIFQKRLQPQADDAMASWTAEAREKRLKEIAVTVYGKYIESRGRARADVQGIHAIYCSIFRLAATAAGGFNVLSPHIWQLILAYVPSQDVPKWACSNSRVLQGATPVMRLNALKTLIVRNRVPRGFLAIDSEGNYKYEAMFQTSSQWLNASIFKDYPEFPDVIEAALRLNIDVNSRAGDGMTLLHHVKGKFKIGLLIARGSDINAQSKRGQTALHGAAASNDLAKVQCLLAHGAKTEILDEFGVTPLHYACQQNYVAVIKLILDKMPRNAKTYRAHQTCLFVSSFETQKLLIDAGFPVDARNSVGLTPLHGAISAEQARYLISRGANVNAQNKAGNTPLHYSFSAVTIPVLVEAGANVKAQDEEGNTPLHLAIYSCTDIIPVLVKAGADVNARNHKGQTPLHYWLYQAFAFFHAPTSLHIPTDFFKMLMVHNPDLTLRDDQRRTPLDLAAHDPELLAILQTSTYCGIQ